MTRFTDNGWQEITKNECPPLRRFHIPGQKEYLILKDGPAGFILTHFALWYHQTIRPIDGTPWDDWGWADRIIAGSTVLSNHASGTAMDLNATRYPQGTHNYTVKEITTIHHRLTLKEYGDAIRWGGDYEHATVDQMHFEINVTWAGAAVVAKRLARTPRGKRVIEANPGLKV